MGSTPLVSVIIVNINGRHHLAKCLPAVTRLDYDNYEVIVVDNDSLDGSPAYIAQHFPSVRVIESSTNLGYAGANNLGFLLARGDYLAVLNPDTIVEDRWLSELVKALEANPKAGLATSKIFMMDDPSRINACGNQITVSGITYCRGVGSPAIEFAAEEDVTAVSGAAFIIRRSVLEEVGPFDQN